MVCCGCGKHHPQRFPACLGTATDRMRIALYPLIGLLIWFCYGAFRSWQQSHSDKERAFVIRAASFCGLLAFLFLGAFIVLPMPLRIAVLIPAFIVSVSVAKGWRSVQARLRSEREGRVNLERMKRVN